ncbi:MAG TPA: Wzz/FepE/Etk N-terminal domain-containing protein [Terriglobales bacterium]|nr:Wzz/FepE/Etk N-terminal domain-containing protein [Terriglobales bacterium]
MIENRDLTMDDYLAMVKRRLKVILIPALLAPIAGYLVSYAFPPKFTSQATVLVEVQKVPGTYVQPVITADLMQRVATMKQQILAPARLRTMIDGLNVAKPGEESAIIQEIQSTMTVAALSSDMSAPSSSSSSSSAGSTKKSNAPKQAPNTTSVPGFLIGYSSSSPRRAQEICNALVGMLVQENLRTRSATAKGTTDFLSRQVDEAKQALDQQDKDLAEFKAKNLGQLPSDADNNMRILMSMNSQLDATTQTLNRAQQDKAYTESLLAQQLAAWKSSQSSNNPQTLEQQLNILQAQLMQQQARYTDDHPDVIKTKADIVEVKKRLAEINNAPSGATDATQKASASEPPEIRQLRLQLHQYDNVITQATQDQKRLQSSIQVAQSRTLMSPAIEEEYRRKTRDYDNAQNVYQSLLAKKSSSELGENMENQAQGEQLSLLTEAGLPSSPTFPNRWYFAGGGMGAGLVLGIVIAVWLEIRDRSIRTERDAAAAMDLPLLVSVPWVSEEEEVSANGHARRPFWGRGNGGAPDRERIGV